MMAVAVEDISWGEDVHLLGGSDFDCIIASEVIYNGLLYDKLLDTIKKVSSPNTRMIMSYEKRSSEGLWCVSALFCVFLSKCISRSLGGHGKGNLQEC